MLYNNFIKDANIKKAYTKINNGYILIASNSNIKSNKNIFYSATIQKNGFYLSVKHFGQYASKNTLENFIDLLKNYFTNCKFIDVIPLEQYNKKCFDYCNFEHLKRNFNTFNNAFCFGDYRLIKYNNNGYLLYTKNGAGSNYFNIIENKPVFDSMLYVNNTTKNKIKTLIKHNFFEAVQNG